MEKVVKISAQAPISPDKEGVAALTDREQRKLLMEWNQTKVDYPRDKCIPELFQALVRSNPEAVAVVFQDQHLTYRELNERANQLAHRLRTLGVNVDTPVGVYVDRSANFVIGVLGILKAGGNYIPLDTDYPAERLQFTLRDACLSVVIADQPLPKDLCFHGITMLDLVNEAPSLQAFPKHDPDVINDPGHLAYVIYTSGSTGQPKGVAIPHRGVVRLVCGQNYAPFDNGQRFLMLASTSFDASTFELWGPLLNGGRCVVFPKQPVDFCKLEMIIRQQGVTCLWLTAGLFNQIIDARPSILETVRHVMVGGEALSVPHVQKAMNRLPNLQLTNGYGPTESTTFACTYAIPQGAPIRTFSVPIGRPIANTRCYLLDQQLQPVPIGVAGELHIGGDGLARGYHNRPELTAEKFIANPYSTEPEARLYKTGDLARYLPDGNIEFLGRMDHQVKIRGFRIEPGEIEAVLAMHPNVLKAAVIAREDVPGHKHLVAYLVARQTPTPTTAELREFLLQKLPAFMVPAAFIILSELPLTANGKVDRKALHVRQDPVPVETPGEMRCPSSAQESPLEQSIARIWREVLQQPVAGLDCNFFDVGGDSIRIASLHVHLQQLLDRQFPITDLFVHTTIRSMAAHFNSCGKTDRAPSTSRIRAQRQREVFMTRQNLRHNKN